ncbi:hypothetical protein GOODEAATRI_003225 [Goodea atripinnis]|uniref:SOWAHA-C winged helix-turn-helix domain-containing protein n=1 Tax=Goodea atripinnis TaxID=208336 RepID=A0ABV0NRI3_9TELE
MATDFTLDSVLVFLQSCGGLVKNTELLLHFKPFLRDHPDEVRNRELFKKFVNSVATVTKIDGVSNVVLRKKFRGYVSGGGSGRDSAEPCPVGASSSPAVSLAPPGHTERTSALPAAGIMVAKNNLVETSSSPQQRENLSSEPVGRPAQVGNEVPELHETPAADQSNKQGQNRLVSVPITGLHQIPARRFRQSYKSAVSQDEDDEENKEPVPIKQGSAGGQWHLNTPLNDMGRARGQNISHHDPIPEPLRGQQIPQQDPDPEPLRGHEPPDQDAPLPVHQIPARRFRQRQSYKSAVSQDEDEDVEQVPIKRGSAGGQWPLNDPLSDMGRAISASSPCITDSTSPTSSFSGKKVPHIYIQDSDVKVLASQAPLEFRPILEPGSVPEESLRRSLPSEAQRCIQVLQSEHHLDKRPAQALEPGPNQSQRLSSSHSSVFNSPSDVRFFINDQPPSGSSRTSGWDSSTRAGTAAVV